MCIDLHKKGEVKEMKGFDVVKNLMTKDNTLDEMIYEFECEHKRDITEDEKNSFVQEMLDECLERARDLSCSLEEAYNDIMH